MLQKNINKQMKAPPCKSLMESTRRQYNQQKNLRHQVTLELGHRGCDLPIILAHPQALTQ